METQVVQHQDAPVSAYDNTRRPGADLYEGTYHGVSRTVASAHTHARAHTHLHGRDASQLSRQCDRPGLCACTKITPVHHTTLEGDCKYRLHGRVVVAQRDNAALRRVVYEAANEREAFLRRDAGTSDGVCSRSGRRPRGWWGTHAADTAIPAGSVAASSRQLLLLLLPRKRCLRCDELGHLRRDSVTARAPSLSARADGNSDVNAPDVHSPRRRARCDRRRVVTNGYVSDSDASGFDTAQGVPESCLLLSKVGRRRRCR